MAEPKNMTKTDRAKLRKDKPGVWVPVEPGDSIRGKVVEITAAWSDVQYDQKDPDSGFYPLLRIDIAEGEATGYPAPPEGPDVLAVHCFSAVLQGRVLEQEPAYGEEVIIRFEGTSENAKKGQNPADLYRLEMPGRDPEEAARKVYDKLKGRQGRPAPAADPAEQ